MESEQMALSVSLNQVNLVKAEVRSPEAGVYEVWCWFDLGALNLVRTIGHGKTVSDAMVDAALKAYPAERLPGM